MAKQKIAIVHDWLYGGGAEKVVLELHRLFPDAPIYTSYCSDEWREKLDNAVVTGYLQKWPFRSLRKFLPILRQRWFRSLDLSAYDMVISSSGNGEAKFVRVGNNSIHVCYCHTPTHFYWRHHQQYLDNPGFGPRWLAGLGLRLLVGPLRRRDYHAAQNVDYFIANSTHIQADIERYYDRPSHVVYPPVDVAGIQAKLATQSPQRRGFVTLGRQAPLKRLDIIVEACNKLKLPLTVIGNGPEYERLVALAGETVTFKTDVTDEQLPGELAAAEAFLFASHEDFGIAPVEAMAVGTPVIAYKAGGALDYVEDGKTGLFFNQQTAESLAARLEQFGATSWDYEYIAEQASQFSSEVFRSSITDELKNISEIRS